MRLLEWSLTVRGHRFAGCLMVLGAILGGSVSALGQSWPGYGHDSQHTSLSMRPPSPKRARRGWSVASGREEVLILRHVPHR